jgi:hypothetical protein
MRVTAQTGDRGLSFEEVRSCGRDRQRPRFAAAQASVAIFIDEQNTQEITS